MALIIGLLNHSKNIKESPKERTALYVEPYQ